MMGARTTEHVAEENCRLQETAYGPCLAVLCLISVLRIMCAKTDTEHMCRGVRRVILIPSEVKPWQVGHVGRRAEAKATDSTPCPVVMSFHVHVPTRT